MKTFMYVFAVCVAWQLPAAAQDTSASWSPSISLSVSAVPLMHISGTDTSFSNGLSLAPVFSYRNTAGFGVAYSPQVVLGGSHSGIYVHQVSLGWEQYNLKKVDFVFEYTHDFFTGKTDVPYSPLNNELYGMFTYKVPWIRPYLEAGLGLGKDTTESNATASDVAVAAGISHTFSWALTGGSQVDVSPKLALNAGTNQYFSLLKVTKYIAHGSAGLKHISPSSLKSHGRSGSGTTTNGTNSQTQLSPFALSNIEGGISASLQSGNFSVRPSASIYIPVRSSADNSIYGYWQLDMEYDF